MLGDKFIVTTHLPFVINRTSTDIELLWPSAGQYWLQNLSKLWSRAKFTMPEVT